MSFSIRTERAAQWVGEWEGHFGTLNPDPTSTKTLIFLTLLERQDEMTSYQDIADELNARGVLEGKIDNFTPLRNGMAQLGNALQTHNLYELENRKSGKESNFRLKRRSPSAATATIANRGQSASTNAAAMGEGIVTVFNDPELTASTEFELVAEKLMLDRRMPFYGIYLPMPAASRWVLYSEGESKERSRYEAAECERLLGVWLSGHRDGEISVIGLGVGEGIGEIEILRRLLTNDDYNFSRIHYCAVDTNVHLLMDHVERLKHIFKDEMKTGRLVCGVICGNFLEDFPKLIRRLRDEFGERGQLADAEQGFLPNVGTLVTILGNVVGNLEQRASEWSYFRPVLEELKNYDIAFLFGVSVQQVEKKKGEKTSEKYSRNLEDLLLATPKYLTHELTMLRSHQPEGDTQEPEFVLPEDRGEREKRWPAVVEQLDYLGEGLLQGAHVKGKIYEFYYQTQWDLSLEIGEEVKRVPAGTNLLLYNIIKFDEDTLIKFLESKGLLQARHTNPSPITSGNEDRRYAVIAMTNKEPRAEVRDGGLQARTSTLSRIAEKEIAEQTSVSVARPT